MKRKLLGAALAACFSAAMVTGSFAGELTAEEILQNYVDAYPSVNEMCATVDGKADINLSIPDQDMNLGITGSMAMDMDAIMNPLQAKINASMSGEMMGQGGSLDMTMYMVTEDDGSLSMYMGLDTEEGQEWTVSTMDAQTMSQFTELLNSGKAFTDLPISFELADNTVDVNGNECYALVASLGWQDIMNLYTASLEMVGEAVPADALPDEETIASVGALFGGLVVNIEMDVNTENYMVQKLYIDLDGSDWVTLGATVAAMMGMTDQDGNLMSVSLDVKDLYLEYLYDYSTPVSIEVPQDVIDNATDIGSAAELTDVAATMVEEAQPVQ